MIDVKELIESALASLVEAVDVNEVVGNPITDGDNKIAPICRVTIGYVGGGGEVESKNDSTATSRPLGAVGGGVTITPLGFLIINRNGAELIKVAEDCEGKWTTLIKKAFDSFKSRS